jgi:hypothetical protein
MNEMRKNLFERPLKKWIRKRGARITNVASA